MFNIEEYYLGIIIAHPSYYNNPKRLRYFGGCSFDPFEEVSMERALCIGVPTLLHKIEEKYYDEYYSIYKNELGYHLNEMNSLGIVLAYARPFQDYYEEEAKIYYQEELDSNYEKMEEVFNNHSYYVVHYKTSKNYAIVQLDTEPMKLLTKDYIAEQIKKSGLSYQKK